MFSTDSSDSTLLQTFRDGRRTDATPAARRSGDRAVIALIDRHRVRAFSIRNSTTPSLSDEVVEDVLVTAIVEKARHERLFRIDGDAEFGTWLHRVLRNSLITELRKQTYREANEAKLTITTSDGNEVDRAEIGFEDEYDFIAEDALRVVLDVIDDLASAHRLSEEVSRTFLLRHMHSLAFPGKYSRKPGRPEVMSVLGVSERRARTLVDHADALLEPVGDAVAKKLGVNRPTHESAGV